MSRSIDWRRVGAVVATFAVAIPALVLATGRPPDPDARLSRGRTAIAAAAELHWDLATDGRHVVVAHEYGEPGLFLVDATGEIATEQLPTGIAFPGRPALSPDGRLVAYQSVDAHPGRTAMYLFDRAAGITRTLVPAAPGAPGVEVVDPTWSPDGRRLAYARIWRDADGAWRGQLREIEPATGHDRLLFEEPGRPARAPAYAPDGMRIAFLQDADLMEIDAGGGAARRIHAGGTRPAPSAGFPDAPVWLPGGDVIAYAYLVDGCHRVALIERAGGEVRWRSAGCAMRPRISTDGSRLAYLQLGASQRTLRWRPLPAPPAAGGDGDEALGFPEGVTYEFAFVGPEQVIALASTPTAPRSLWRFEPGHAPVRLFDGVAAPLDPALTSVVRTVEVRSRDGLALPVEIFPRTCGAGPGPAIVWLHGGPSEDIAPRWYQEPQYLAALGWSVFAVNYRGSTGNGESFRALADDRDGQIDDVVAALAWVAARPDVDPQRIVVLSVSWSTQIAYPAIARSPVAVRGVIDWLGLPQPVPAGGAPPALWLSGRADRLTPGRRVAAATWQRAGVRLAHVELDGGHEFRTGAARRGALAAAQAFLASHGGVCDRAPVDAR